jgi:PAS domain S-box-containing protein
VASVRAPSRRATPADRAGIEERLALVETLNACIDPADAAQRALDWLASHAGVTEALCLALDGDGRKLVGIGARGPAPANLEVDLDDHDDPLATAFAQGGQTVVARRPGRPRGRRAAAARAPLVALPLQESGKTPCGLLVVSPPSAIARQVGTWVAGVLGPTLGRAQTRRALEETERRLRRERGLLYRIINAVSDPILLTDREERIVIANARAEALFAAREDESEGRRRAVSLNNMLFSAALSRGVFEDIENVRHELPLVDPHEGEDLLFELIGTPVMDDSGAEGVVSILRNVTDLRLATAQIQENYDKLRAAEAEVRAERDRLDLIIDSVADPIIATDPTGNVVMLNAPAERLFTAPPDAGDDVVSRVRANDAHFTSFIAAGFLTGGETRYRGEINLLDPVTGATIPVEAVSGKIFSLHGELTAIVTILHDRTEELERARLYEELKRSSEQLEQKVREATAELVRHNELLRRQHIELEQASALKSQFLANMSHEFRTPLNAILGYTSMLLQGVSGEVSSQQKRSLSRIDSNARHLLAIINDILDIARIEAGKMPLTLTDFKVSELIDEVAAELEPLIARSTVTVKIDAPSGLPALRSDRQKVKQIVLNLLSNALKFTADGWVRVAVGHEGETVLVSVEDTGIGIAPEDQERIFEDFRQADNSPTREYGGAGLGLAICRRLAAMLGGAITLRSEIDNGSTFTLVLPARPRRR